MIPKLYITSEYTLSFPYPIANLTFNVDLRILKKLLTNSWVLKLALTKLNVSLISITSLCARTWQSNSGLIDCTQLSISGAIGTLNVITLNFLSLSALVYNKELYLYPYYLDSPVI